MMPQSASNRLRRACRPASLALAVALGSEILVTGIGSARAEAPAQLDVTTKRDELSRLQAQIVVSDETLTRLRTEIHDLNANAVQLKNELVLSVGLIQDREKKALADDMRLKDVVAREKTGNAILTSRLGLLSDVPAR